jgi:C-terminal processing protease CtpA/Prc
MNEAKQMKVSKTTLHGRIWLILTTMALLLTTPVFAGGDADKASESEEKALQEKLEAEYERAIVAAEQQRLEAEKAAEKARMEMREVAEMHREQAELQREQAEMEATQAREQAERASEARRAQQARMAEMQEELSRARRELREAQREIARVDREVARAQADRARQSWTFQVSQRPVIGVILGEPTDVGVTVLGVSPDGPSDRAGVKQGDVIIALGGQVLAAIEGTDDPRDALKIAMKDVQANEPLTMTLERDNQTMDLTVVPEVREPMSWHTVTRFPSAPHIVSVPVEPGEAPEVITIERMVVPEIDTAEIAEQIETMKIQIERRGELLEERVMGDERLYKVLGEGDYEFEFHELSELGDYALSDANIWFGLPLTRGLKLAEVDEDLGDYFKTDRGVLVLKAREDNDLQLVSGDVILKVADTDVNSPAEFMRALRDAEPGEELAVEIKRKRKGKTLKVTMPENRTSFFFPKGTNGYSFEISSHGD